MKQFNAEKAIASCRKNLEYWEKHQFTPTMDGLYWIIIETIEAGLEEAEQPSKIDERAIIYKRLSDLEEKVGGAKAKRMDKLEENMRNLQSMLDWYRSKPLSINKLEENISPVQSTNQSCNCKRYEEEIARLNQRLTIKEAEIRKLKQQPRLTPELQEAIKDALSYSLTAVSDKNYINLKDAYEKAMGVDVK